MDCNKNKKLKIELKDYHYKCGDGCCDFFGTRTYVNGILLECRNDDRATILEQVLEHLGYKAEVIDNY